MPTAEVTRNARVQTKRSFGSSQVKNRSGSKRLCRQKRMLWRGRALRDRRAGWLEEALSAGQLHEPGQVLFGERLAEALLEGLADRLGVALAVELGE
jgi:hypothetical protein